MKELDETKTAEDNAYYVFKHHSKVSRAIYMKAALSYFTLLKLMEKKEEFFSNTYYSERGISYFIYGEFLYFSILIIERQDHYFGRFKINP